ncbi:hypothetical protein EG329_005276 [Mollisiaceae sp. DMI_Dod_QoI]|nr:hypothetical protein EG329_005276 [Helotiales sp. DMI_Dod_QoI]
MYAIKILSLLCMYARNTAAQDDLGLSSGFISFSTPNFNLKLVNASQTLASLSPKINPSFNFSPFDLLSKRAANGNYHLGDISVRYRWTGNQNQEWVNIDSAATREPVLPLKGGNGSIATSNLLPTIPKGSPLNITRQWSTTDDGDITLSVTTQNIANSPIEIGGFGFPIEFNSIFTSRTAEETEEKCSLTDPNIGLAGGYLRVTPSSGAGASLIVTPLGNTTFEGWRFLPEDTSTVLLVPAPSTWGRVRVDITYEDGAKQTISYLISKAGPQQLSSLGNFLTTSQWYTNSTDQFHRAPSIITYDRSINKPVLQDPRVWIAGLSDEGGAGSWLAAAMKQAAQPNLEEVSKIEDFIHETVLGTLQPPNSSAVRKSVFFYQPNATSYAYDSSIDWTGWPSWDIAEAYATNRAYDYVHVSAVYWALYRVARFYPELVKRASWDWYLLQSYNTVMHAMSNDTNGYPNADYSEVGLMGETVWGSLLADLQRENYTSQASIMETRMKKRAEEWANETVPYGSEMAWDSTGQEGVYYWTNYFGLSSAANKTINSVLGYMPTVSHWGWNGNARRYWDFTTAGKLQRIERQIHHYGSGLNALPLLQHFQQNPSDLYSLRVGYGGNSGPMSNIDQEGFASAAFHSWPDTLAWDAYSGDYGPNFLGHVLGAGTYVVDSQEMGLIAFGGELEHCDNGTVKVVPKDAVRRKVYLGIFGTRISVDAGNIEMVQYSEKNGYVSVQIASSISSIPMMAVTKSTVLRVEKVVQVGTLGNVALVTPSISLERGGWMVDLSSGTAFVEIGFQ